MICEIYHGTGKRLNPALNIEVNHAHAARVDNASGLPLLVPCDECGGSGLAHCCEGLRAQPD